MTSKDMREALEAARSRLITFGGDPRAAIYAAGSIDGDEMQAALLDMIDAALSAIPAPVSEEEDGRELFERVYDAVYEANGSKLDDGASVLCVLRWMLRDDPRLSRTEGEWRPDPKTVDAAAKCVPTNWCDGLLTGDRASNLPLDVLGVEKLLNGIAARIRSLLDQPDPEESIRTRLDDQHVKSSGGVRTSTGKGYEQ